MEKIDLGIQGNFKSIWEFRVHKKLGKYKFSPLGLNKSEFGKQQFELVYNKSNFTVKMDMVIHILNQILLFGYPKYG